MLNIVPNTNKDEKNMKHNTQEIEKILSLCDVKLNGNREWDLKINNDTAIKRMLHEPSIGSGESYMDGWWDCARLDEFFFRITRDLDLKHVYKIRTFIAFFIKHYLFNQQSILRSKKVAKEHYDLGNDLYEAMLGETMAYTCGYWHKATTLDEAQYAKYDLICKKVNLQPNQHILELGCGWGGFAKYAAKNYGVKITAVNISQEQMNFAQENKQDLPIDYITADYRNINKYNPQQIKFDHVISIGMCEHVGHRNYKRFMHIANQNLSENGLFLMHTIGKNNTVNFADPWIQKYIFPHGMLPSVKQIATASEPFFVMEDMHNFGADYDKTLMAWFDNFEKHWPALKEKYGERFYRMWKYYLLSCAGAFRSRNIQLWQYVFSPKGVLNGYHSIR